MYRRFGQSWLEFARSKEGETKARGSSGPAMVVHVYLDNQVLFNLEEHNLQLRDYYCL